MLVLLLSLVTSVAHAQDANADGCVDSFFDANGACVATSATVDATVSVDANAEVGPYAYVGGGTSLGVLTFIGSRATVVGRVMDGAAGAIGSGTVIGRRAVVGADQDIGADNTMSRAVRVGERFTSESNVSLGYAAQLGNDVSIGAWSTLGSLVEVGNNTEVTGGAIIARGVIVADSPSPLDKAVIAGVIGPNVHIGALANFHPSLRIRKEARIGDRVTALSGVRIGRDAIIGDDVILGQNVVIRAGGIVTATSWVPDGTVVGRGEVYNDPGSAPVKGAAGRSDSLALPGGEVLGLQGIPTGVFYMGCWSGRDDDASGVTTGLTDCAASSDWQDGLGLHDVTLTHELWCGETEVTQAQFTAVSPAGHNPSLYTAAGTDAPVERVSWHDAAWYANELSALEGLVACYTCDGDYASGDPTAPSCAPIHSPYACNGYRLPTEAEWEFLARGGAAHPYAGLDLEVLATEVAWYADNNSPVGPKPVGGLLANGFGLHDMSGNVSEWVNDWSAQASYGTASVSNPAGAATGTLRGLRGAAFDATAGSLRSALRASATPSTRAGDLGFRVCKVVPSVAGIWSVAPAAPVEGEDNLVCTATVAPGTDDEGVALTPSITWEVNGVAYAGATSTTTNAGDTIAAGTLSADDTWSCSASVVDGGDVVVSEASEAVTVAAGAPALYWASGPQTNVPESSLVGWEQCFSGLYGELVHNLTGTVLGQQCTGSKLMEACRPVGASNFTVLAMGNRSDVLFNTGDSNTTHEANGVAWYYSNGRSMGFASAGDPVYRNSCDTETANMDQRLCWHTSADRISGGWSCGEARDLNGNNTWERVIYQAD